MAGLRNARLNLRRVATALLFTSFCSAAQASVTVQSLRYGTVLFDYFQRHYFQALTGLMVGQQLHELGPHSDGAELLRGGMNLSWGMDRSAQAIFSRLLADPLASPDHDQAWFYLGKLAWQRGSIQRAELALAHLDQSQRPLPAELAEQVIYLQASMRLQDGDLSGTRTRAEALPLASPWRYYLFYNLGGAYAGAGQWSAATDFFERAATMPLVVATAESRALRDRALAAAGFARLAGNDLRGAMDDFSQVRLDSPLSQRALLGYGWALGRTGDYLAALSPWQTLAQRPPLSDSVREGLMAVPWAYEQLGQPALALDSYRRAAAIYQLELQKLEAAISFFEHGELTDPVDADVDDADDWLQGNDVLPLGEHLPYLRHLVSGHDFQLALHGLRDLHRLTQTLAQAQARLAVLARVDEDQHKVWSAVLQGDRRSALAARQEELVGQLQVLRERMQSAREADDPRLLADEEQFARWQRLEHASDLQRQLAASSDSFVSQGQRLALLRGLMVWRDYENSAPRAWAMQQQDKALQQLAADTRRQQALVDEAVSRRQRAIYAPRIDALQTRLQAQAVHVHTVLAAAQGHVRQLALVELRTQAAALHNVLGRSRLAVARLYDQASPEIPR